MKFVYLIWSFEGLQYKSRVDCAKVWEYVKEFIKFICVECEFDSLAIKKYKCGAGFNQLWIMSL